MCVQKFAHERIIDVIEGRILVYEAAAEMDGLKWRVAKYSEGR